MRIRFLSSAMILAIVVALAACNASDTAKITASTPEPLPGVANADGVNRVTPAELDMLIQKGKAFIVDVRTQDAFNLGHIPGARLIPAGEVLNHVNELPRDKVIVTYCS